MKHHAERGIGVARRDSRLEHPVDDAAIKMHMFVQRRAEAMDKGHRPAAGRVTTAGTVVAQTAFHLREENAQHRALQVGIIAQEVAQAFGNRQHPLAHGQAWEEHDLRRGRSLEGRRR